MAEKIAPVQGYAAGIPWSMHLRAYDAYCKKWGAQPAMIDLEGRNCRGGFSVGELDDFIPGWRDELSEIGRLRAAAVKAIDILNRNLYHQREKCKDAISILRKALYPEEAAQSADERYKRRVAEIERNQSAE